MPALKYWDIASGTYKYVTGGMSQEAADARYVAKADNVIAFTGMIVPWGGTGAPTGWLECDGSNVSRTTYAALFAVCGVAFGVGNGSTTFGLPDLRGRIAVGRGAGSFNNARGSTVGAETHTLTVAQMPSHTHTVTDPGGWNVSALNQAPNTGGTGTYIRGSTIDLGANPTGGGGAHNNIQPSMTLYYVIKT